MDFIGCWHFYIRAWLEGRGFAVGTASPGIQTQIVRRPTDNFEIEGGPHVFQAIKMVL